MIPLFGQTRSCVKGRHALFTVDSQVPSVLPGVDRVRLIAQITPALGAKFVQMSLVFEDGDGVARFPAHAHQTVVFVVSGQAQFNTAGTSELLTAGGFAYVNQQDSLEIISTGGPARIALFQKQYAAVSGHEAPASFFGLSAKIQAQPFLGNSKALLQVLLPDHLAFDFAMNIFTYQPGATLPFVETHVMEHGLLMLSGQGIYRLEDSWYPVTAGDVIWMAPFCPQWFIAMGDEPASYLYYKDVNRTPLL